MANEISELQVEPMGDGGMGSLLISRVDAALKFGRSVARCEFLDADGVRIEALLNCDTADKPMEIDLWKVNFGAILRWPERANIRPLS